MSGGRYALLVRLADEVRAELAATLELAEERWRELGEADAALAAEPGPRTNVHRVLASIELVHLEQALRRAADALKAGNEEARAA